MLEAFKYKNELEGTKKVSALAANHVFEVNPSCVQLGDNKKEEFHTTTNSKGTVFMQKNWASRFTACSIILVLNSAISR